MSTLATQLLAILPVHKCSLSIEHNTHKDLYQTAEEYLGNMETQPDFADVGQQEKAIDTGELWELRWYPETAVGCHHLAAPTLEELLAWLQKHQDAGSPATGTWGGNGIMSATGGKD